MSKAFALGMVCGALLAAAAAEIGWRVGTRGHTATYPWTVIRVGETVDLPAGGTVTVPIRPGASDVYWATTIERR